MIILPSRRKKQPLGVRQLEKRESNRHRAFVRGHECIVPGCMFYPIRFCHVRAGLPEGEQAGVSQKPHDCFGYPGCDFHHDEQHRIGEAEFERKYKVRLLETALGLALRSTDPMIQAKAKGIKL